MQLLGVHKTKKVQKNEKQVLSSFIHNPLAA